MERGPTQAVLPLVGLAADKPIGDRNKSERESPRLSHHGTRHEPAPRLPFPAACRPAPPALPCPPAARNEKSPEAGYRPRGLSVFASGKRRGTSPLRPGNGQRQLQQ
ncbi:MAG: hypothetical protein ACQESR_15590 [Planctomycetota bacterium]